MDLAARTARMTTELQRRLDAAQGWYSLGNFEEAERELDAIEEEYRLDFPVLVVRAKVFRAQQRWEPLQTVGCLMSDLRPDHPSGALAQALAVRHLHGPERALGILMEAAEVFPDEAAVFYDLACYECVCGNLEMARGWLNEAYRLAPQLGKVAQLDADLVALRR